LKKLRWQLLVVLVALVAIAVLLLGQRPVLEPGGEPAVAPVAGGKYIEGLVGSPGRFNPVLDYYNPADHDIDRLIYSSLVRFDDRGLPYGELAETWGISKDGSSYSFSLRPNALWHDGQPVTSDDVVFTVELMRNETIPLPDDLRNFWKQVKVTALNEKTLQFILPEPFAPFLDYLTFGILPRHLLGDLPPEQIIDASFNLKPVGSGPFRFVSLQIENGQISSVELAPFEDYFGKKSFISQVIFRYYPDSSTAMAAYKQGTIKGISQVTPDVLPEALKEPKLNLFSGRLPRLTLVFLNLNSPELPFFQDAQVRRALLMGINRRWIVERTLQGQAFIADGPVFPESWAYYEGIEHVEFDTGGAIALLKAAGYTIPAEGGAARAKDNVKLAFQMLYPDLEPYRTIARQVQSDWLKLGVQIDLKAVPYEDLVRKYLEPRSYQAALVELNFARSPDPDPYPFWHQAQKTNGQNYSGWDDRQVSEYLEQARVTVDYSERLKRYRNFQVRFAQELPALTLYYPVYTYAVDEQVKGVSMGPLYDTSDRLSSITGWYLVMGMTTPGVTPTIP
jgi:peptide/nickel transport system substrate-binding protein